MSDVFSSKLHLEYGRAALRENTTGLKSVMYFTRSGCSEGRYRNGPGVRNYVGALAFSTALNFYDFRVVCESQTFCF